jgi:putative serine protease PepD
VHLAQLLGGANFQFFVRRCSYNYLVVFLELKTKTQIKGAKMTTDKGHFNTQFLGEPVKLPAQNVAATPQVNRKAPTTLVIVLIAAIGSIVGAYLGAYGATGSLPFISSTQNVVINNPSSVNWVSAAAAKGLPSVVTISASGNTSAGTGSGVVLTNDGYILTNAHVVTMNGSTDDVRIEIKTSAGKIFKASIVGTDPTNDLAVIKAAGSGFSPIDFADSSVVNVGDFAVAIGAPLGYDATVTSGVISALNRTISVESASAPDDGGSSLQLWQNQGNVPPVNLNVIQTDAAINPGNSGGALVNDKGELIGINVAIASSAQTSSEAGNIGVGFAIPSNVAKRVADAIIETGKVSHGLLGAIVSDAKFSESAGSFSVGAKIEKLSTGGAAEQAGLKVGDVIIECDGKAIDTAKTLTAAIRSNQAFAKVSLKALRDGSEITVDVTLGDASTIN